MSLLSCISCSLKVYRCWREGTGPEPHTDSEPTLPLDVAIPFIQRMVPVAIFELNNLFIYASLRETIM